MSRPEALKLRGVEELAIAIGGGGGTLTLIGESIELFLPGDLVQLLPGLKQLKPEMIAMLRRVGGRIAHFPMCPNCGSHALHRKNSIGAYECLTCELQGIEERTARIASFLADSRAPLEGHLTAAAAETTVVLVSGLTLREDCEVYQ
jgi:hypothetical protein